MAVCFRLQIYCAQKNNGTTPKQASASLLLVLLPLQLQPMAAKQLGRRRSVRGLPPRFVHLRAVFVQLGPRYSYRGVANKSRPCRVAQIQR